MSAIQKILLVEDEPKLGLAVQEELNRNGYPADLAVDGLEALRGHNFRERREVVFSGLQARVARLAWSRPSRMMKSSSSMRPARPITLISL